MLGWSFVLRILTDGLHGLVTLLETERPRPRKYSPGWGEILAYEQGWFWGDHHNTCGLVRTINSKLRQDKLTTEGEGCNHNNSSNDSGRVLSEEGP